METQGCKRVVLRSSGGHGRRHLNLGGRDAEQPPNNPSLSRDATECTAHDLALPLSSRRSPSKPPNPHCVTDSSRTTVPHHSSPPPARQVPEEIHHSTPTHLTRRRDCQSSSSSPSWTHTTAHCHGGNEEGKAGKMRKRRWRKGKRVHPVSHTEASTLPPSHQHQHTTPLSPPSGSLESSSGLLSLPPPALHVSLPTTGLSYSLPPLLSSQLRKGGRRPSPSVNWGSDGGAELERCLPGRQLRVYVGTWNMQQLSVSENLTLSPLPLTHIQVLPDCLDQFLLPATHELVSDLYVVGTQESTSQRREWEILVQQTLGPSHLLIHSASLGELCILAFLRRDLLWFCSDVQSVSYATRPGAMIKTKGGIGMTFSLFGTSFLFVISHLSAHRDKVTERNSDMQRIAANVSGNGLGEHDCVFWFGDLNYRVDMERSAVDQFVRESHTDGWLPLLLHDQLTKEMLNGNVFQGFSEQPIQFPPSYKFDTESDSYDSSEKQRTPSWTDRILFRSRRGSGISGCGYDSCQSLRSSDHRPVYAVFNVVLEPSCNTDGVPDVMAEFNREVYRIANQRRKEVAGVSLSLREEVDGPVQRTNKPATSSVCTIL